MLVPGSLAGRELFAAPAALDGRIYLAYPTLPSDRTAAARATAERLLAGHAPPPGHANTALTALAGANLLVEGLERAGRELSRDKLIAALEGLFDCENGLPQPLTYGANRRIGARGAHVVALDLATGGLEPAGGWIEIDG